MVSEPVRIGDILWKSLDTLELKKDIFPKLVEANWQYILGPTLMQHCNFFKLEKETLYIKINTADWFRELTQLKLQLIDKFNGYFKKKLIADIKFIPAYAKPRTGTRIKTNRKR